MDFWVYLQFIIKLVVIGVIPWAFLSRVKSFYFEVKGFDLPKVFNAAASLLGLAILICFYFQNPYILQSLWSATTFTLLSIALSIIYFIILFANYSIVKEDSSHDYFFDARRLESDIKAKPSDEKKLMLESIKAKLENWQGLVIIHFLVYIALFIFLSLALVKSKIHENYVVFEGYVLDIRTGQGIYAAEISLRSNSVRAANYKSHTDKLGHYELLIDKRFINVIDSVSFSANSFTSVVMPITNASSLDGIARVVLGKN